jgi:phage-related protein
MERLSRPARPLRWIRSSQKDYREFPPKVQDNFGFELFLAQTGQHPPSAKLLKGMGSGMVELVDDFDGDTYRAVYTVRFESAVYVLHVFKKEVEAGHQDSSGRYRTYQTAAEGCASRLCRAN